MCVRKMELAMHWHKWRHVHEPEPQVSEGESCQQMPQILFGLTV